MTMPIKTIKELVAEAKEIVDDITPDELIEAGDSVILLDVRDESDYEEEHLPNAVSLPRGYIELDIDEITTDENAHIVTYCGGGTRATLSAQTLRNMGYENVSVLTGGFRGWKTEGLDTEKADE
ncbi:sulfurtransferase [Candidatus Poribacteria bacterium]|nr:MAG: sulfurtransferase [Candidatus Poribacteria bacterium]